MIHPASLALPASQSNTHPPCLSTLTHTHTAPRQYASKLAGLLVDAGAHPTWLPGVAISSLLEQQHLQQVRRSTASAPLAGVLAVCSVASACLWPQQQRMQGWSRAKQSNPPAHAHQPGRLLTNLLTTTHWQ